MSLSKIKINNNEIIGVDEYPTNKSKNLVESRGIYDLNLDNIHVNNIVLGGSIKNEFIVGQYLSNGERKVVDFNESTSATDFLSVDDNYYIKILNYGYDLSPIGFFDSNKEFISFYPTAGGGVIRSIENLPLKTVTPSNAKYVIFSSYSLEYDYEVILNQPLTEKIEHNEKRSSSSIDILRENTVPNNIISSYTTEIFVESLKYVINSDDGLLIKVGTDTEGHWKVSNFIDISFAVSVSITASSMGGYAYYAFYDKDYTFMSSFGSEHEFVLQHITDYLINVPINAYYIRLGCCDFDDRYPEETQPLFDLKIMKSKVLTLSNIWSNKKWGLIGDSLTERNFRTTVNYADYINQSTGINLINKAVSGAGYKRGHNFITQISELQLDVDVITVFGSVNDTASGIPIGDVSDHNVETLCSYINSFISAVRTKFPTTPFGIISPTPCMGLTPLDSDTWMSDYSSKLKDICSLNSVPFLDLYHCSNLYPNDATFRQLAFSKDDGGGTHPDETGHRIIAPRFKSFLETLLY